MKPGRELDLLVAEKVMGWRPIIRSEWPCIALANTPDNEKEIAFLRAADLRGQYEDIPNYSTDIAAAWEVVEKMCPEIPETHGGYCPQFELTSNKGVERTWTASFYDRFGNAKWGTSSDKTFLACGYSVSAAICLAALKAVGYSPEEK